MKEKARRILRAAEKLFMSRRYHEVTLEEVASKAGVGKGTIYRYFENKEDLYYQMILTGMDELAESLERCAEAERDSGEQLRCLVAKIVEFFTARRSLFGLMHSEQFRTSPRRKKMRRAWKEKNRKMVGALASAIGRGIEAGTYRDSLSPGATARLLLGAVRSALWHRDDMPEGPELARVLTDLFEMGLCPRTLETQTERGN